MPLTLRTWFSPTNARDVRVAVLDGGLEVVVAYADHAGEVGREDVRVAAAVEGRRRPGGAVPDDEGPDPGERAVGADRDQDAALVGLPAVPELRGHQPVGSPPGGSEAGSTRAGSGTAGASTASVVILRTGLMSPHP
ncbi:hypothetical protein [Kitasatospora herbaricolor]|uniref:Uncharacterized protein n=1 Tax=Kitasatospora herbaricolor TaxID=68217 RepID=A0ABZ1WFP8_9ACTN|nr:hypothetical protein [Kitasatospora herbaricolor]